MSTCFALIAIFGLMGNYLVFLNIDKKIERTTSALYLFFFSIFSVLGKFVFSFPIDKIHKPFLLLTAAIIQSASFLLIISFENGIVQLTSQYWPLYALPIVNGFA